MFIRQRTFVEEQGLVTLEHHINAEDGRCFHFVAYACDDDGNEVPIGSLRVLPPPNEPRPHDGSVILHSVKEGEDSIPSGEVLFGKMVEEDIEKRERQWEERRPTDMWDGKEWFLHFARMCVLPEWRGRGVADLLVKRACEWAEGEFEEGFECGKARWNGLLLANAREEARRMWERNGFVEDKGMGRWNEVGVELFAVCRRMKMKKVEVEG